MIKIKNFLIFIILCVGVLLLINNVRANIRLENSESEAYSTPDPILQIDNPVLYSTIILESPESELFIENLSAPVIVDNIAYNQALLSDITIESAESRPFSFNGAEVLTDGENTLAYSQIIIESPESETFQKAMAAGINLSGRPGSFDNLLVSTSTCSLVTLSFEKAERADGYRVFCQSPAGYSEITCLVDCVENNCGCQDNSVQPATTYSYYIEAYNQAGTTQNSDGPKSITTPPCAPGNFRAETKCGEIKLLWDAALGATSYRLYQGLSSEACNELGSLGCPEITPADYISLSYPDREIIPNVSYYYRLVAVAQGRESKAQRLDKVMSLCLPGTEWEER